MFIPPLALLVMLKAPPLLVILPVLSSVNPPRASLEFVSCVVPVFSIEPETLNPSTPVFCITN